MFEIIRNVLILFALFVSYLLVVLPMSHFTLKQTRKGTTVGYVKEKAEATKLELVTSN